MPYVLISRKYNDCYIHRNSGSNSKPAHDEWYLTHDVSAAKLFDDDAKARKERLRLEGFGVRWKNFKLEPLEVHLLTADDLEKNEMLMEQWKAFQLSRKLCS
jgi:hypothetical protein